MMKEGKDLPASALTIVNLHEKILLKNEAEIQRGTTVDIRKTHHSIMQTFVSVSAQFSRVYIFVSLRGVLSGTVHTY